MMAFEFRYHAFLPPWRDFLALCPSGELPIRPQCQPDCQTRTVGQLRQPAVGMGWRFLGSMRRICGEYRWTQQKSHPDRFCEIRAIRAAGVVLQVHTQSRTARSRALFESILRDVRKLIDWMVERTGFELSALFLVCQTTAKCSTVRLRDGLGFEQPKSLGRLMSGFRV
jgi:hypothetical protein